MNGRERISRRVRWAVALVMGTMALLLFAGGPSAGGQAPAGPNAPDKLPFGPGPGAPTGPAPSSSPAVLAQGRNLYEAGCSSCHGYSLQGRTGMGPALAGVGAGPVDFYLSSGRMPLANPRDEPERATPAYPPAQIAALVAFVASYGGPPAPTADPARGDLALGRHAFTLDCAGCHQVVARGGLVIGAQVPNLLAATPSQLAEAVRMGPYLMPRFDATQIDQHTLDSIARYVQWTKHPDNAGGWGLYNIGPVPEGMVAWLLALGSLLIVIRLIGERSPR